MLVRFGFFFKCLEVVNCSRWNTNNAELGPCLICIGASLPTDALFVYCGEDAGRPAITFPRIYQHLGGEVETSAVLGLLGRKLLGLIELTRRASPSGSVLSHS